MLTFLLGTVVLEVIMLFTYAELMSMERRRRQKQWKRNVLLKKFVTSKISSQVSVRHVFFCFLAVTASIFCSGEKFARLNATISREFHKRSFINWTEIWMSCF